MTISWGNAPAAVTQWCRAFFVGTPDLAIEALAQFARVLLGDVLPVKVLSPSIETALVNIILDPSPPGYPFNSKIVVFIQIAKGLECWIIKILVSYVFVKLLNWVPGRRLLQHPQSAAVELGQAVRIAPVLALRVLVQAVQEFVGQVVVVVYGTIHI